MVLIADTEQKVNTQLQKDYSVEAPQESWLTRKHHGDIIGDPQMRLRVPAKDAKERGVLSLPVRLEVKPIAVYVNQDKPIVEQGRVP